MGRGEWNDLTYDEEVSAYGIEYSGLMKKFFVKIVPY